MTNASSENGRGDEKWKDDHRQCRKIEIGRPIFNRNTIFRFKLKSRFNSTPEHALGYVQDLKPFVRGQVDGHHVSTDLNRLQLEISTVNGSMEQPVRQIF